MIQPSCRMLFLVPFLTLASCGGQQAAPPASSAPVAATAASVAPASKPAASAVGSAPASKPAASARLQPIKIAYVAISTTTLPTWIADAKGFFRQQGLDPQIAYVAGSTTAIPALASGDVAMIEAQAAASVQAQLQGQDTVSLATHVPFADLRLMSVSSINSLNDLKGKSIAVTKAGTVGDIVARAVLPKYGLVPDKDVRIVYLDTQPGELAALQNGSVPAIIVPPPFNLTAEKAGARMLFDFRPLNFPYPTDGVVTTRKYIREHPDLVNAYLKAYVQAVRFAPANPDESKKILSQQTKESDPAILDEAYKVQMNDWSNPPTPTIEGIQTLLPLFPGGEGKNPADFIDPAPLEKAVKELDAK